LIKSIFKNTVLFAGLQSIWLNLPFAGLIPTGVGEILSLKVKVIDYSIPLLLTAKEVLLVAADE